MRWTRQGAHHLLQIRVKVLNKEFHANSKLGIRGLIFDLNGKNRRLSPQFLMVSFNFCDSLSFDLLFCFLKYLTGGDVKHLSHHHQTQPAIRRRPYPNRGICRVQVRLVALLE